MASERRRELRDEALYILASELLQNVAGDEHGRFTELMSKVETLDRRLWLDLDEAHSAVLARIEQAAFVAGYQVGRDPSVLLFKPEEDRQDER